MCKHAVCCISPFAVNAFILAVEVSLFNLLFMGVLRINKWIHELDSQKGRVQIYAGMKIGPL